MVPCSVGGNYTTLLYDYSNVPSCVTQSVCLIPKHKFQNHTHLIIRVFFMSFPGFFLRNLFLGLDHGPELELQAEFNPELFFLDILVTPPCR